MATPPDSLDEHLRGAAPGDSLDRRVVLATSRASVQARLHEHDALNGPQEGCCGRSSGICESP